MLTICWLWVIAPTCHTNISCTWPSNSFPSYILILSTQCVTHPYLHYQCPSHYGTLSLKRSQYCSLQSILHRSLFILIHSFSSSLPIKAKKSLYHSLVRSKATYAWQPHMKVDNSTYEYIKQRTTKFLLNNHEPDYKSHLASLHHLPLMLVLELNNIVFIDHVNHIQDCFDKITVPGSNSMTLT